jgi:hypothetical protein
MADATEYPPPTLAAQVVEHALGENLHDWIKRVRGHGASWRHVAKKISLDTGHDRHEDTVRSWYPDLRDAPAKNTEAS